MDNSLGLVSLTRLGKRRPTIQGHHGRKSFDETGEVAAREASIAESAAFLMFYIKSQLPKTRSEEGRAYDERKVNYIRNPTSRIVLDLYDLVERLMMKSSINTGRNQSRRRWFII